jgi:hypothetical protein
VTLRYRTAGRSLLLRSAAQVQCVMKIALALAAAGTDQPLNVDDIKEPEMPKTATQSRARGVALWKHCYQTKHLIKNQTN